MGSTAYYATQLGRLATIAAGYPFRGAIDALPPGPVAAVQMRDMGRDGEIDWPSLARVELPSRRQPELLRPGDIIFTTRGRRNAAMSLLTVPVPAVCSPHFFVMRVRDPSRLDPRFLAWQLNQRPAREYFQQEATGSHILNITRAVMEAVEITTPPMERQRAILALDDLARAERVALARLIDNRNQQIEAVALGLQAKGEPAA